MCLWFNRCSLLKSCISFVGEIHIIRHTGSGLGHTKSMLEDCCTDWNQPASDQRSVPALSSWASLGSLTLCLSFLTCRVRMPKHLCLKIVLRSNVCNELQTEPGI